MSARAKVISFKVPFLRLISTFGHSCRERKRDREREDLWKKLENLSLSNAKKEGISLDLINHVNSE